MQQYKNFRPTPNDTHIVSSYAEEWYVVPCYRNRDSNCADMSNFQVALDMLQNTHISEEAEASGGNDWEELSFNHWACGHFSIIVVRPNTEAYKVAEQIEAKLADYPLLDEDDVSERQQEAAQLTWKDCYNDQQRIDYIRKHRSQFESLHDFADLLSCVRGYHFAGYASELIGE